MEWQNIDLQITQFSEHTATTEKSNFPPFAGVINLMRSRADLISKKHRIYFLDGVI